MSTSKIKDVAIMAGVSSASVSRAVSGQPGVSETTRCRVLLAARELNYRPDQVARSMRRRTSNLIGLVVSTIENVFFTEIARAAEQEAIRRGFNLLISNTDEHIEREEASFAVLRQQLVAGIILAPAPGDISSRDYLANMQCPVVLINRDLGDSPYPSIVADDEESAFQCTRWLIRQGRRRIGVVAGLANISTTQHRLEGCRRALEDEGLPYYPELQISGKATFDGGYEAARDLMIRAAPPDALFVHNNVMLMGAMLALQDLGIRWPKQVDIAGFGAFSAARLYQPPLTLIAQPTHEMGARAVALLIDLIEGRAEHRPQRLHLANRLVTRDEWISQKSVRATSVSLQPISQHGTRILNTSRKGPI